MRKHLPDFQSILQVYAVIAVMFAGWTSLAFLWKLSAWLLLLNLGEIFTLLSYSLAANFLESLLLLSILLTGCVLLPAPMLRDVFVVRGTILSVGFIGSLMAFVGCQMLLGIKIGLLVLIAPLIVLLLITLLLHHSSKHQRVRSLVISFSDRVVIFLFILMPLFAGTTLYVIFRNVT